MADPLSITASIVGITAAGVQVSISLFALAETVSTASERVSSIANDISSTCGILNQLRDLITPQPGFISAHNTSIFNPTALSDIHSALHHCRSIFSQIKKFLERATKQIKQLTPRPSVKISLSRSEKAKWPFLQAAVQELRNDLRDSKTNLLLMLAVANLAMAQRRGQIRILDVEEQADLKATIVRLQRMKTLDLDESDVVSEEEKESLIQRLMQKLRLRRNVRKEESEDETDDERVQNVGARSHSATGIRDVVMNEGSLERGHPADAAPSAEAPDPPHQPSSHASRSDRPDERRVLSDDPEKVQTRSLRSERKEEGTGKIHGEELAPPHFGAAQGTETFNKEEVLSVADFKEVDGSNLREQETEREPRFVDVAVQTSAGENALQDQIPFMAPTAVGTPSRVQQFERVRTSKFPHRATEDRPEISKAQGSPESVDSSRSGLIYAREQVPSSINVKATKEEYLQAWIFSVLPGLTVGQGSSLGVMDLSLSEVDIRALLQKQEAQQGSPSITLNQLNNYQRCAVLAHAQRWRSRLLYVDVWQKESIPTVFGDLEIVTLMWITSSAERIDACIEAQFEEQNWSMGLGDWKGKGKANDVALEPPAVEEPLYFKDAVGRHFVFPFHLVKTWKGIEELIKQAFLHVDIIGPHVHQGHYDLIDDDGKIILPQIWSHFVKPGWKITMHMWPMPEPPPPKPRPQRPVPPPPDAAQFQSHNLPLRPRVRLDTGFASAPPPPPPPPPGMNVPPPAHIYVPPLNHGYLRQSVDGKQNDMSVLKWMAGAAGPGLGKPSFGKRKKKEEEHGGTYKSKLSAKEEDKIVDNLLLKWTG